jgi:uncharacterized membrane protein YgcG
LSGPVLAVLALAFIVAFVVYRLTRNVHPALSYEGVTIHDLPDVEPVVIRNANGTFAKGSAPITPRGEGGKFVKRETSPIPEVARRSAGRPVPIHASGPGPVADYYEPPLILPSSLNATAFYESTPSAPAESFSFAGGGGDFGGGGASGSWGDSGSSSCDSGGGGGCD